VLLTALAQAFAEWTGAPALLIDLAVPRAQSFDGLDLTGTVGWLSYRHPLRLDLAEIAGPAAALKAIKEQLRAVPSQGIGYAALRYLTDDATRAQLRSLPQAEVCFAYEGIDTAWSSLPEPLRLATPPAPPDQPGAHEYALAITARIADERLQLNWAYVVTAQQDATITELAERTIAALRALIAHCQSPDAGGYTPSDFPLAGLSQSQLDRVLAAHEPIADIYPLGPFQAHMLEQRLHHPESGLYLASGVFEVPFAVDGANFERAWQQVIERHPVLRSSFMWAGLDQPLQLVHKHAHLTMAQADLRALTPTEQQARVAEYFQAVRRTSFALTSAPHTDIALFRVGDESYRFVWTFDYMLQDGWGFLLIQDFLACYQALSSGQPPQLELPRPYRDYIAWTRQQDMAAAEAFWRAMLSGFTKPTPLKACVPGNAPFEAPYMSQNVLLPAALTTAVQELARQHQLTPYTLLQAAWARLLSDYTGANDVVYGVVVSGRPPELAGVDQMVGLFNNLLPMRVRIEPAQPLLPWLKGIQDQLTDLRQYEYSPPLMVQQWSDVPADQPLFESYMVYENLPISEAVVEYAGSKQIRAGDSLSQTEHPLRFVIFPGPQIMLNMSFYPRHFDPPTIARILADFQATLERIVEALKALNR
jgi:non-ribosomal peptide synthase protein (TIGR01720 family)